MEELYKPILSVLYSFVQSIFVFLLIGLANYIFKFINIYSSFILGFDGYSGVIGNMIEALAIMCGVASLDFHYKPYYYLFRCVLLYVYIKNSNYKT